MNIVVVIILGLILAVAAGFSFFLLIGPLLAGRYHKPHERRRENRHSHRRKLTSEVPR